MNTLFVFLQAAAAGTNEMWKTALLFGGIIVVFYFFMIRPQQKKQKAIQQAQQAMKSGDKVLLAGGIHGKIKEVNETNFLIEIADGVKIKVERGSVFPLTETSDTNSAK